MKRDTTERFISSKEHGLTPAGEAFLIGYMANSDPDLAAEALAALREHATEYVYPKGFWFDIPPKVGAATASFKNRVVTVFHPDE